MPLINIVGQNGVLMSIPLALEGKIGNKIKKVYFFLAYIKKKLYLCPRF